MEKPKTAADFLALLGQIECPGDVEEEEVEEDVQVNVEHDEVVLDLPTLKQEGVCVDFESWFNANPLSKEEFDKKRPDMSEYIFNSHLCLSTDEKIPKSVMKSSFLKMSSEVDEGLCPAIFDYRDFFYSGIDWEKYRQIVSVHALNHIYNDLFCKKSKKFKKDSSFTPTTVLVMCPYKLQAYRFVTELLKCLPDKFEGQDFEVENFDKFKIEYGLDKIPNYLLSKPKDWFDMFAGRTESEFKTGIRFWNNKVSLCQEMAKSQMVIISPLSLFLHKEKEPADFMSSVEILILDSVDALFMQSWDRLCGLITQLNKRPSTVEGCDWSRVRTYCLQSNHAKMRQTIGYGSVLTPEIHHLFVGFANKRGGIIIRPLSLPPQIVPSLTTNFRKLETTDPTMIGESLWKCFKEELFPLIRQWRNEDSETAKRTIIYYVSSSRFFQARKDLELNDVIFLELGDEAADQDEARMKKAFLQDPQAVLLLTERYYFHRRTRFRDVGRVIFMQPPTFPGFVSEIAGNADITIYFTEYDELALERVTGSRSIQTLMNTASRIN